MSIAFLPGVPSHFSALGLRVAKAGSSNSAKAHSIGIEKEYAVSFELDFLVLLGGFIAAVD
ncbi:MAG: hypothetical protein ACKVY0_21985 [Prosthecobacter sp.]|uniref:hypothetical protein n=1 Tax=Prosthecobacter sp. TaxID=1965333 RepID=UPI0038FE7480